MPAWSLPEEPSGTVLQPWLHTDTNAQNGEVAALL
jgi:hypothetical protein